MTITSQNNLVFIISQPRSGSTMLQRILGSHLDIYTTSETWLMLYPLYSLRENTINYEYDTEANLRYTAFKNFLNNINTVENPQEYFFKCVRTAYEKIYIEVLKNSSAKYFLDKTPRYYHIIDELYLTFPNAKFIFLLRNPLATFSSMISSWAKGNYLWISKEARIHDILSAPELILRGINKHRKNCHVVHYEDILASPESTIRAITDFLQIKFHPDMILQIGQDLGRWLHGDQDNVYRYTRPELARKDIWVENLNKVQVWRLLKDFLEMTGEKTMNDLDYPYDDNLAIIMKNRPSRIKVVFTLPLKLFLKTPQRRSIFEKFIVLMHRIITKIKWTNLTLEG